MPRENYLSALSIPFQLEVKVSSGDRSLMFEFFLATQKLTKYHQLGPVIHGHQLCYFTPLNLSVSWRTVLAQKINQSCNFW
jgi:hypothetical protein